MFKLKCTLILVCTFFLASPSGADRLILKEGKTIHGTIIDDKGDEYTMRLKGSNMVLRVNKTKVKKVIRKKKKAKPKNVVTYDTMAEESKPAKQTNKQTLKKDKPKKEESPVKNPNNDRVVRVNKKNTIEVTDILITKPYAVSGKNVDDVLEEIYNKETGKGFKGRYYRQASKVTWSVSWKGSNGKEGEKVRWKNVVVRATITVESPRWQHPKKPKEDQVTAWNEFHKNLSKHNQGHVDIYLKALTEMGEKIASLRASNKKELTQKSEEIFQSIRTKADKRQVGFDRRRIEKGRLKTK